jgi:hypothetical protein
MQFRYSDSSAWRGPGFLAELLTRGVVGERADGKDSYSDVAIGLFVVGAIDHTHPSFSEFFDDPVVSNSLANYG